MSKVIMFGPYEKDGKKEPVVGNLDMPIVVPNQDKNIKFYAFLNEEHKFGLKMVVLDLNKEFISLLAFDSYNEAYTCVNNNYAVMEKEAQELRNMNSEAEKEDTPKRGTTGETQPPKGKSTGDEEDALEVNYPGQNKNVRFCVVKARKGDGYNIKIGLLDVDKKYRFLEEYKTQEEAVEYIKKNHALLEQKAYAKAKDESVSIGTKGEDEPKKGDNTRRGTTGEDDPKKGDNANGERKATAVTIAGAIVLFAAFAGASIILCKSCKSCIGKGTGNINPPTDTPEPIIAIGSEEPTQSETPIATDSAIPTNTPMPTNSYMALTIDDINNMSQSVLDGYMRTNSSFGSINNGGVNGSVITTSEIRNAIAILNIDELSIRHFSLFQEILSSSHPGETQFSPDAFSMDVDRVLQSIMTINMQEFFARKYSDGDKTLEGLTWLSPMIIDEKDQKDMKVVEGLIEGIMQADLNNDVKKVQELAEELRNLLNSQPMKNRGTGFDRALYNELEVLVTCAKDSMTKDQLNNIITIKETKRETTYVNVMNILSNLKDYGCAILDLVDGNGKVIDSTIVRTRHC